MVSQVMGASSQINIRRRMPQVSRRVRDLLLLVILSGARFGGVEGPAFTSDLSSRAKRGICSFFRRHPERSPLRAESKDPLLLPICHHERSEGSALSSAVIPCAEPASGGVEGPALTSDLSSRAKRGICFFFLRHPERGAKRRVEGPAFTSDLSSRAKRGICSCSSS